MDDYELWVTSRCAHEDLGLDEWPDSDGVWRIDHVGVRRFRESRRFDPEPKGQHISETRPKTLYKLRHGARLRGASWYDRFVKVVFFVAWGEHTSGDPDDFYQSLVTRGDAVYPQQEDYDAVEAWKNDRWIRELQLEYAEALVFEAEGRRQNAEPVPIALEIDTCTLILVAYPVDGSFIYLLRLDQPETGPYFTPQQAAMVAQVFATHVGSDAVQAWTWNGAPLPVGSYAFDF